MALDLPSQNIPPSPFVSHDFLTHPNGFISVLISNHPYTDSRHSQVLLAQPGSKAATQNLGPDQKLISRLPHPIKVNSTE